MATARLLYVVYRMWSTWVAALRHPAARLNEKDAPLCESEKRPPRTGLQRVMIRQLNHSLAGELIPMHVAVSLVVIDTQEAFAVRKLAFPALGRSF